MLLLMRADRQQPSMRLACLRYHLSMVLRQWMQRCLRLQLQLQRACQPRLAFRSTLQQHAAAAAEATSPARPNHADNGSSRAEGALSRKPNEALPACLTFSTISACSNGQTVSNTTCAASERELLYLCARRLDETCCACNALVLSSGLRCHQADRYIERKRTRGDWELFCHFVRITFLIAVSITVAPGSASTVRAVPPSSINVILTISLGRCHRPTGRAGSIYRLRRTHASAAD